MMIRVAIVTAVLGIVPVSLHYAVRGADAVDRSATSYASSVASDALNRIAGSLGYERAAQDEQYTAQDLAEKEALIAGINPALVRAMMRVESGGDQYAESSAGARSLLQVMPANYKRCGLKHHSELWKPELNVKCGVQIISEELATYKGNVFKALIAYNAGPRGVTGNYPVSIAYANTVLSLMARDIR